MEPKYTWVPGDRLDFIQNEIIKSAYIQTDGNLTLMSKQLGISKATMYRRMEQIYGVEFLAMRAKKFNRDIL